MKVVYLDSRGWIQLHKEYRRGEITEEQIGSLVQSDEFIFPLSLVSFEECIRLRTEEDREERLKLLWRVSDGWGMAPKPYIEDEEICRALAQFSDRYTPIQDFRWRSILGQGLPQIVAGGNYQFTGTEDWNEEEMDILHEMVNGERTFMLSKMEKIAEEAMNTEVLEETAEAITAELEQEREEIPDNDRRRRIKYARYFVHNLAHRLTLHSARFGINPKQFLSEPITPRGQERVMNFLKSMNSFYANAVLTNERDLQDGCAEPNDLYDIMSLSVAIPYSNVVYTEKKWKHLATHRGDLDETYDTEIVAKWSDFKERIGL